MPAESEIRWTASRMFVRTDAGDRYFMGLAEVDPERPAVIKRWLIDEERDVEGYAVDHAERSAIVVVNDGVYDAIPVVDLANGLTMELIDWKDGGVVSDITGSKSYHLSWSCDDRSAFASWEHPTRPAEVHEWPRGRGWTNVSADDDFREPSTRSRPPSRASMASKFTLCSRIDGLTESDSYTIGR